MDLREFAEMVLASKAAARRSGAKFEIDLKRAKIAGIDEDGCNQVLAIVTEIEDFRERKLSSLQGASHGLDRSS